VGGRPQKEFPLPCIDQPNLLKNLKTIAQSFNRLNEKKGKKNM